MLSFFAFCNIIFAAFSAQSSIRECVPPTLWPPLSVSSFNRAFATLERKKKTFSIPAHCSMSSPASPFSQTQRTAFVFYFVGATKCTFLILPTWGKLTTSPTYSFEWQWAINRARTRPRQLSSSGQKRQANKKKKIRRVDKNRKSRRRCNTFEIIYLHGEMQLILCFKNAPRFCRL